MKNLPLTLILAVVMLSCGSKETDGGLPVVDVTKSYPAKELILQDVADVEYIPLETREGFLVDYFDARYMDDEIMVMKNQTGDIMIFDRQTGKGITSFNRTGRGPIEYSGIHSIAVDREGNEIFVTNSTSSGTDYPIYVYDLTGKPLRMLRFKEATTFPRYFVNYDGDHLLFYSEDILSPEPYMLLPKRDTLVTRLPVSFEERNTMMITQEIEGGSMSITSGYPITKDVDGYMLSEPGTDTIFLRTEQALTPIVTQTPAFNSMETPIGLFFIARNSDYIFLQTVERKMDMESWDGFQKKNLFYEKASDEIFEGTLVNGDYVDRKELWGQYEGPKQDIPANTFVYGLQPFELLDLHEAGKLQGKLAEIAPTLKEDDNPVMMIMKFK
jgi:hypothetical protein